MKISAKDQGTGKENKITIKSDSGLSKDEIERMILDAEANAETDKKQRELIEARNNAESTLHGFKGDVEKYGDLVTAEEKANAEDAVKAVEDAVKGDNAKIIQDSIPKLYEAMGPITGKKSEAEAKAKSDKDNNIVDAEVTETI